MAKGLRKLIKGETPPSQKRVMTKVGDHWEIHFRMADRIIYELSNSGFQIERTNPAELSVTVAHMKITINLVDRTGFIDLLTDD